MVSLRVDEFPTAAPPDPLGMLRGLTLPAVFEAAVAADPDAPALQDGDLSWTWRAWKADVDALAGGLQELGVGAGDVVAVQLPNCWQFPTVHLAVAAVGAVMMPVHQGNGSADVLALLERVDPVAVVLPYDSPHVAREEGVTALRSAVPSLRHVLVAGGPDVAEGPGATGRPDVAEGSGAAPAGVRSLEGLLAAWAGRAPASVDVRPEMPFVLLPSSGTTSARPKICRHSHDGLLSNSAAVAEENASAFTRAVITACPLTHLFGLQSLHNALFTRCRQVLLRGWDPDRFLELARASQPSVVFAVPAQLHDVVNRLADGGETAGFGPREVRTAGAAIPGALVSGVREALGSPLVVVWGMSEIGTGTCTRADDPADVARRSVGRPTFGASVRIVAEDGTECAADEPGELRFRSPGMFQGYHREPELTRAAVTEDGWLRTGDLASLGADGRVTFLGRSAELINVGGRKFNATEIQGILAELPGLGPLAVVGRPDRRLGEYPCLVLTSRADGNLGLGEVTAFLQDRGVAEYKIPLELLVVDELPRTPAGKPHRRALEQWLAADDIPAAPSRRTDAAPPRSYGAALELVRTCVARVLGPHEEADPADGPVGPDVTFRSQGLDSIRCIRLRNLLADATGLPLPASLAFDHPTPADVARLLTGRQGDGSAADGSDADGSGAGCSDADVSDGVATSLSDPVVVVGMACRLPGGVTGPDDLWSLVMEETDAVSGFPADRGWYLDHLFDDDPDHPGTSYAREGGFLHDAGAFDAAFFGFSDREALATDPQQRLLLETAWEALERAGIDPRSLRGTRTAVFAGAMYHDYASAVRGTSGPLEGLLGIGTAASALTGRISHTFGLQGPAVTVDTACSSSLVALHLACQSLRSGESSLALAGGVAVMSTPSSFTEFSRLRGLSPDGRCKSFADSADGAAWSEGVGLLVLQRLSDARRDGRKVLAVVRGSAVNQDGVSNGLTAPNGTAQRQVVRRALADAGLTPIDVDAVEAHGTGTTLGDPIEAQALLATYGRARPADRPLWLGSVKSNIGHAQAAAGVAGVIKAVLALEHGVLPRTLHVDAPSSRVDWSVGEVQLLTEARPWPRTPDRARRAGVSSFGISGTNAHVILEEAPEEPLSATAEGTADRGAVPWVLSARSPKALREQARRLADHLADRPGLSPRDLALSLATTRTVHAHQAYVVGSDRAELLDAVRALADRESAADAGRTALTGLGFVFTGQGSQRPGMGRDLARSFPVFDAALDALCAELDPLLDRPLREVMWSGPAELLDRTEYAQPALFAYGVALYRLVESWGVVPARLVGHSVGEITAAHVAGALPLADACRLVAARGRLMQALPAGGAMAAVRLSESEVAPWLDGLAGRVAVAAVNAPDSVVLSGAGDAVAEVTERLTAAGHRVKPLTVSHAFHSPLMDPMLDDFRAAVGHLDATEPAVPVVSCLTGDPLTGAEVKDPGHWVRHVREPVRFEQAVRRLLDDGTDVFVELGPRAALTPMVDACAADSAGVMVVPATGPDGEDEERAVLAAVARLHLRGLRLSWESVLPGARVVPLPTYPFQHRSYWLASTPGPARSVTGTDIASEAPETPADDPTSAAPVARLSGLGEAEQRRAVLRLVLEETSAVLGGRPMDNSEADTAFTDMGMTSVSAVELRNRITTATGARLPATLIYDHPTPAAVVRLVREDLNRGRRAAPRAAAELVDELDRLLSAGTALDPATAARLEDLVKRSAPAGTRSGGDRADARSVGPAEGLDLESASDEDLFRLMDGVVE
ncbi:beta-ketoacyl synthase N-terminal-like domain-containing protein [Streptomyces sp. NPDC058583]|uniref:type I polyketide synthase n=1 Tax=unclassified Streptomyces TaxID=2593676 RepID=UPI0036582F2F